jgi:hypothetical protein
MGIDAAEATRRDTKVAHYKSLEKLAKEALHEAELAYQYVGNSYTYNAMSAMDTLVRRLGEKVEKAQIEAEVADRD